MICYRLILLPIALAQLLIASVAQATMVAPDLVRVEVNLTWSHIPWLSGPVNVSGSNLWQSGVGYVDAQGLVRPSYVVTGTGFPSAAYFDIGWNPAFPLSGINLEAAIPGGVGPDGSRFPGGFQHFTSPLSEAPGNYPIDQSRFINESGPLSTYGTFFADSGSVQVIAVPELVILHIYGPQLNAVLNPYLQRATAWGAAKLLRALQVPAVLDGRYIVLPSVTLEVQEWCSGVSSVKWFALLGLLLALTSGAGVPQRLAIFLTAPLIAIEANMLRVAAIGAGYEIWQGSSLKEGVGWATLILGVGQVLLLGRWVNQR
jgi:exosortase/archaeosortase family protein